MSVFHVSVLLLTMNFHSYFDNVMTEFIFNNTTDARRRDVNLFTRDQRSVYGVLIFQPTVFEPTTLNFAGPYNASVI